MLEPAPASPPSGWSATELSVRLRRGAGGRVRAEGVLCSAPVWFRWDGATLWLVGSGASPVGEDRIRVHVELGAGVDAAVRSVAATVVYAARGAGTSWDTEIEVHEGARLDWAPEPVILTERARHVATTRVRASSGAELTLEEVLVLGRSHEATGALRSSLEVRVDDAEVLCTSFDTSLPGWSGPGGVAGRPVVANRLRLGPGADGVAHATSPAPRPGAALLAPAPGCGLAVAAGPGVAEVRSSLQELLPS